MAVGLCSRAPPPLLPLLLLVAAVVVMQGSGTATASGICTGITAPAGMVVNRSALPSPLVNGSDVGAALSCSSGKFRVSEPGTVCLYSAQATDPKSSG
eukprot:COSAG05_NODE_1248_length_5406_cov_2.854720_3_plen_98_part_00